MEGRITVSLHIRSYYEENLRKEIIIEQRVLGTGGWLGCSIWPAGVLLAGRSGVGLPLKEAKAVVTQQLFRKGLWE